MPSASGPAQPCRRRAVNCAVCTLGLNWSDFDTTDQNLAAADALAGYATTSAFVIDPTAQTVSLAASMWTHAGVAGCPQDPKSPFWPVTQRELFGRKEVIPERLIRDLIAS